MENSQGEVARAALRERHRAERSKSKAHARDVARALGVSEAELVDAEPRRAPGLEALGVTRLAQARLRDVFRAFGGLGEIKAMTRNEHAVIERWGRFERVEVDAGPMGQVVGEEIDLRLFFRDIASGFVVVEPRRDGAGEVTGLRRSVQLFDRAGDSAFKLYLEDDANVAAFEQIAEMHADREPDAALAVTAASPPAPRRHVDPDEIAAFREDWDGMSNTHEFFGLLRKHQLSRTQALDLAGPERARRVGASALRHVLERAAALELPIMIFVGSRGVLQIHGGPIHRVAPGGGYLNVLDPRLNVHVREAGVARIYGVRKPTADGVVSSLELFDEAGETIAWLFSKRKPHQPELAEWTHLLAELPTEAT